MRENRHLTRWRLIYYLRVFERDSGKLLGHVVDITVEGMMLVSAEPIEIGRDFDVHMALPAPDGTPREIAFRVHSLWKGEDVNTDFHDTGFRLVDPSEDAILAIREVIEDLRFPGPPATDQIYGLGDSGTAA